MQFRDIPLDVTIYTYTDAKKKVTDLSGGWWPYVIGGLLEPRLTGNTLNLSPIVILLSLGLWGSIWGVMGMFLCVPLMTILNIILAQFNTTRPLAVLLTADGQLPEHGSSA